MTEAAATTTTEAAAEHGAEAGHAAVAAPVGGAIYMAPDNHVMDEAHHAPVWVKVSPFIAMLIGLFTASMFYIRSPDLPGRLAKAQPALYQFLLNKWYFDEIYNFIFVRPTLWLGRFLWKKGDGTIIDGTINGIAMGLIPRLTRRCGPGADGLSVPLCLRDGPRIQAADLVMMRGAHWI